MAVAFTYGTVLPCDVQRVERNSQLGVVASPACYIRRALERYAMYRFLTLTILSALTLTACVLRSEPPSDPPPAVFSPDCPIVDATPDASEADRIFHDVAFAFVADVYSRHVILQSGARDVAPSDQVQAARYEDHARSLLTHEYNAWLSKVEQARLPLHSGSSHTDFRIDSLSTDIRNGQATQKVVYCVGDRTVWTQVFHLVRTEGRWKIDNIEPAAKR